MSKKENGGEGGKNISPPRFSDLIGDTKPISRGPERAATPPRKRVSINSPHAEKQGFRFPNADQPRLAASEGVSDEQLFALGRGEPEPEERIDLHGLRREAAARLIVDRLKSARARGLRCVLVIHGRGQGSETGEAVLRDSLPGWLSKPPGAKQILAFAPAPKRLGGDGATLILLRKLKR